jgi:hypothetical protein
LRGAPPKQQQEALNPEGIPFDQSLHEHQLDLVVFEEDGEVGLDLDLFLSIREYLAFIPPLVVPPH